MDTIFRQPFVKFLVVSGLFLSCNGATVQFFTGRQYTGRMYELQSSTDCRNITSGATNFWSIKSPGCIVVFENYGCITNTRASRTLDIVFRSDESSLGSKRQSFRECTDLEKGPEVNLDYYAEDNGNGQVVELRDICSCTNLTSFDFTTQSINTYGNYFTFYADLNCRGKSRSIPNPRRYTHRSLSLMRSVRPSEIPSHCSHRFKITAEILKIEPVSDNTRNEVIKTLFDFAKPKIFDNNSPIPLEYSYEASKNISETTEIQLSGVLRQMSSIRMGSTVEFITAGNSSLYSQTSLQNQIVNSIASTFQSLTNSDLTESIKLTVKNEREMRIQKNVIAPLCTKLDVSSVGYMVNTAEMNYRIILSVTGQRGFENLKAEEIEQNLTGFVRTNISNDYTLIAESTAKMQLYFGDETEMNVIVAPITECRSTFLKMSASIFRIEPLTNISNLEGFIHHVPVTYKQTFINNGTAPQEDSFETTTQIVETRQFELSEELNRMNSVSIEIDFETPLQFITNAWKELKSELPEIFQNRQIVNETVKFVLQSNKTFRFQKKINVPPCTKYEINSFVEIAKDVEIEYRVQFRVTGKLGDEVVGIDEIQDNLKGLIFLSRENNHTALAETYIKLKSTFGVGSGVNAEGKNMIDCLEAHAAFVANNKFLCSG